MALTEEQKAELQSNGVIPKKRGRPSLNQTTSQNDENTSSSDNPPKQIRGRAASSKAELERIRTALSTFILAGGALVKRFNEFDGSVIISGAPNLVDAIVQLCEEDKNVRKMFLSMTVGGAYVNVGVAVFSIVLPILLNHNMLPPLSFPSKKRDETTNNNN